MTTRTDHLPHDVPHARWPSRRTPSSVLPTVDLHADAGAGTFMLLLRRLAAEAFGTFLLVTVDCGGAIIGALSREITPPGRSFATGLLVMGMIYAVGDVSGAHFNPAVTFAFAVRGVFPWKRVLHYWAAQLVGAFLGIGLLHLWFGNVADLGATLPGFGAARAFGIEVVLTAILVSVILGTATQHRNIGANAALASGGAVALCSLFSRPISGASMNPARSLAPAVVSGATQDLWIYLVAPFLGALVAFLVMHLVHARVLPTERAAAQGDVPTGAE